MVVSVREVFGPRLQGKLPGRKDYARLCEFLSEADGGSAVFLDFRDVDLVSGSWINAALVPLLTWAADERNDFYPVVCNAKDEFLDELTLVANFTHTCFLVAEGAIPPRCAVVVGALDSAQRATMEIVAELQVVTGAELERKRPGDGIKATAWNNRLKDLHDKRLVRRVRRGREQLYSPAVKEIRVNG